MDAQGYEVCRLNFAKFLHRYYWSFVKADPTHALQYIALISLGTPENNAVKEDQKAIVADYVKELLVHSKAYAALLGELDTEGKKLVSPSRFIPAQMLTWLNSLVLYRKTLGCWV